MRVDYGDGIIARYSHCSALLASAGQEVEAGAVIARVGSTGASTGPHLDIEILKDGELLNPLYYLDSVF
jgi:murein DD-endopeptidase MepM/ murein hydrolase activator NlpD